MYVYIGTLHTHTHIYIYIIYIYIYIIKRLITKCHIPSIQKLKTLKIKPALKFWVRYEMTEDYFIKQFKWKFDW